ncbi:MAG: hypothetical protein LBS77_05110 [Desulfovibrio sp.]|nr:hypothetical protein [Desulfovibrio sp.]
MFTLLGPSWLRQDDTAAHAACFEAPDGGEILFALCRKSIIVPPHHRREMGMVFQNYALSPI